jgi:hypothetical protein
MFIGQHHDDAVFLSFILRPVRVCQGPMEIKPRRYISRIRLPATVRRMLAKA